MAAPTIEKQLDPTKVGFALVNNILQFNKGSAYPARKADIEVMGETITIYPHPDQSFYYNLKEWFSVLAGRFGFIDDLNIDIDVMGLVYDWTDRALLNQNVKVTIYYQDNTSAIFNTGAYLLNGLMQVEDLKKRGYKKNAVEDTFVLTPYTENSIRDAYVRYWYGYPFDFAVHKDSATTELTITNESNSDFVDLDAEGIISRVAVSDGRTDVGLEEVLSLIEGMNRITVSSSTGSSDFNLIIDRKTRCKDGFYIKWLNSVGGYSYWLFDNGDRNRTAKELGEINNDYDNLEDTVTTSYSMGKESNDEVRVAQLVVLPIQQPLFKDMIDSPAFWMFTGKRFDRNNFNDWMGIKLKTSNVRVENAKNSTNNYELVFELPQRNTRKL